MTEPSDADDDYEVTEEPIDTTERLRRYRVLRSDGRMEMLSRAELDELRAFREARAQRRAKEAVRRQRLAIGLAVVPLLLVALIVGRELVPMTVAATQSSRVDARASAKRDVTQVVADAGHAAVRSADVGGTAAADRNAGSPGAGGPDTGSPDAGSLDAERSRARVDDSEPLVVAASDAEQGASTAALADDALADDNSSVDRTVDLSSARDPAEAVPTVDERESIRRPAPTPVATASSALAPAPRSDAPAGIRAASEDAPPPRSVRDDAARVPTSPTAARESAALARRVATSSRPVQASDATFERWLTAWRARDSDSYLSLYSEGFARWGLPPEAWARSRRNRLSSVDWIEVDIADLVRDEIAADTVRYTFRQRYRDPGYADESLKVLVLEARNGRWWITAESDRVLRRGDD